MNKRKPNGVALACCSLLLCACVYAFALETEPGVPEQAEGTVAIMDTPLDGSSVEAFEAGMEQVREQASKTDYRRLDSAIKYLLFYDLSARNDRARLYHKLDGKTPAEIVAMTDR